MGTSMHDRYYEPPEDDCEDMEEYIEDWIEFELRKGGALDPADESNFGEAVCEMRLRDDLASYDDCTPEEKEKVLEYMRQIGLYLGEESYFANL
jgi:hypothetical protein